MSETENIKNMTEEVNSSEEQCNESQTMAKESQLAEALKNNGNVASSIVIKTAEGNMKCLNDRKAVTDAYLRISEDPKLSYDEKVGVVEKASKEQDKEDYRQSQHEKHQRKILRILILGAVGAIAALSHSESVQETVKDFLGKMMKDSGEDGNSE